MNDETTLAKLNRLDRLAKRANEIAFRADQSYFITGHEPTAMTRDLARLVATLAAALAEKESHE